MPVTNGELVQELVRRALVKHPQLNKTGVSGDQGDGHQPYGFAAKQLLNAEKGENVTTQKLAAIAQRLGELLGEELSAEDLVGPEEDASAGAEEMPRVGKVMTAIAAEGAPAVNAEENAHVSISISNTAKD
ncbi:hypothetical protein AAD018_001760 [Aestuariibius insulae]|uniref:hypothetical protein n=1 Tax=Aestuariibius insulae TaxID=2058287 RepID=UPI00345EDBDD